MRIGAIGDIHIRKDTINAYTDIFEPIIKQVDVLLLCGDLTDEGLPEEAVTLRKELDRIKIPIIGVLGNHDYEHEKEQEIKAILSSDNIHILDGESIEIDAIGFAGTKGFAGGFDTHMLPNWGEKLLKDIVQESVRQSLLLERALAKLETTKKIVLLHYSPIRSTLVGESEEIFPFLGSSRLISPIHRFDASLVFHGHAHHGTYEGKTDKGIPVFNVCKVLLLKNNLQASIHEITP